MGKLFAFDVGAAGGAIEGGDFGLSRGIPELAPDEVGGVIEGDFGVAEDVVVEPPELVDIGEFEVGEDVVHPARTVESEVLDVVVRFAGVAEASACGSDVSGEGG